MNVSALFHTASARIEEKIYGIQVGLSVYVGLVRASIQEKIPLLQNHVWAAVGISFFVVLAIQSIILILSLFTFLVNGTMGLSRLVVKFTKDTIRVVQPLRAVR